jgi:hypothetical protein
MSRPYHHVRFRWWSTVDLEKTTKEMENSFKVIKIDYPEPTFYKDDKKEIIVKADTLTASLSLYRAVLSQEKASPFTIKDMKLREKIFEL